MLRVNCIAAKMMMTCMDFKPPSTIREVLWSIVPLSWIFSDCLLFRVNGLQSLHWRNSMCFLMGSEIDCSFPCYSCDNLQSVAFFSSLSTFTAPFFEIPRHLSPRHFPKHSANRDFWKRLWNLWLQYTSTGPVFRISMFQARGNTSLEDITDKKTAIEVSN